jgi:hypothetical protein
MASNHDMQAERYELKYMLPLSLKGAIRSFIAPYLVMDDYAALAEDFAYPIHSIYLDSPGLQTYKATQNGDRNRFKLRLRYYDDAPGSPVFLELKRRCDHVIAKQRCMVAQDALTSALSGDSSAIRPKDLAAHQHFITLMHQLQATPRAHVAYMREAWMSPNDNSVRITMDQDVSVEPKFDFTPTTRMTAPAKPFGDKMVLELKYTTRFPAWFHDLVHTFNLMQSGGPKYSDGVRLYGEREFMGEHSDTAAQAQALREVTTRAAAPSTAAAESSMELRTA